MISLTLCSREIIKPLLRITASLLSRNMGSPCSNSGVHPQAPCASENSKQELGRCDVVLDCWRPTSSQSAARAKRDSPAGTWGYGWAPEMLLTSLLNSFVIFSPVKASTPVPMPRRRKLSTNSKTRFHTKPHPTLFCLPLGSPSMKGKGNTSSTKSGINPTSHQQQTAQRSVSSRALWLSAFPTTGTKFKR